MKYYLISPKRSCGREKNSFKMTMTMTLTITLAYCISKAKSCEDQPLNNFEIPGKGL